MDAVIDPTRPWPRARSGVLASVAILLCDGAVLGLRGSSHGMAAGALFVLSIAATIVAVVALWGSGAIWRRVLLGGVLLYTGLKIWLLIAVATAFG